MSFSAVGIRLTPKGFSVNCLVLRISSRIFSAVASGVETAVAAVSPAFGPSTPSPPALPTAATRRASVSQRGAPDHRFFNTQNAGDAVRLHAIFPCMLISYKFVRPQRCGNEGSVGVFIVLKMSKTFITIIKLVIM